MIHNYKVNEQKQVIKVLFLYPECTKTQLRASVKSKKKSGSHTPVPPLKGDGWDWGKGREGMIGEGREG